ncbi:MAG: AAA family ATPase [Acidobacteria bacterium]|nr:AAA family ATPase [Acidobacteriota bacterium]
MAKIEGIRIANYRVLKDLTLGRLWNTRHARPLTPLTAVIGKNGAGKSSLFDAFGFLADCLKLGVEEACDQRGRGGFQRIRSQGSEGPIEFEIYYREESKVRPITYELAIDQDDSGRPYVSRERLRQRRKGQKHGRPFSFLIMNDGKGVAWTGEAQGPQLDERQEGQSELDWLVDFLSRDVSDEESAETERVELQDRRKLGIATLGALKQHPRISDFRRFVEGWYLSYFTPDAARSLPLAGPQKHLNVHGDNLGNVVQFLEREHPDRFAGILERVSKRIPGIHRIDTERSPDGRLLLRFNDRGFGDPFYAQQMSDGTLKVFAYLIMLEDPQPPPFICIEEPENGLYHKLLEILAEELREHATGRKNAPQIFVTTHQPYFVDALKPEETWILEKQPDGFPIIARASDDEIVRAMVEEGLPLGGLWYSDYLDRK